MMFCGIKTSLLLLISISSGARMAYYVAGGQPSSISINVSNAVITFGDAVVVWGSISPPVPGAVVTISYIRPDKSVVNRRTITSMRSTYEDAYAPDSVGLWDVVASWAGNDRYESATSPTQSFTVVGLAAGTSRITCTTDFSSAVVGTQIKVRGAIFPGVSASVTIELSTDGNSWNTLTTVTSSSNGTYSYAWTPSQFGTYSLRATWPGGGGLIGATSNVVHVFVHAVEEPDFKISAAPSLRVVDPGHAATFTVTLVALYGFGQEVSLSVSNLPVGTTASLNPASLSGNASSMLTISTSPSTPPGTHTLTITGSGRGRIRAANVTLNVRAAGVPSKCLVATATFGSELGAEVQFLRAFRDDLILNSFAGRQFLRVFHSCYYSFSPQIAHYLTNHPTERSLARLAMYPLILILRLSENVYGLFGFDVELSAIAAGLVASSLLGLALLTPLLVVLCYVLNRTEAISGFF